MKNNKLRLFLTFLFAVCIALYYTHPRHVDWFFRTCLLMVVTVFVCRFYRHQFPGALNMQGRIRYTYVAQRCFHCQKKLSLWNRLRPHDYTTTGGKDYCSAKCRRASIREINSMSFERLTGYVAPAMEPSDPFFIDPLGKLHRRYQTGIPAPNAFEKLPGTFRAIVERKKS